MSEDTPDDTDLTPELEGAIRDATEFVEAAGPEPALRSAPAPEDTIRMDPPRAPRRTGRKVLLAVVLLAAAGDVAWFGLRPPAALPLEDQEADLRWAVGQVVRHVETYRQVHGRLPGEADLYGLLGEAVSYDPGEEDYTVTGDNGSVRVEYDGSVPLDRWLARSRSGGG